MIVQATLGYEFSYIRRGGRKVIKAHVLERVPVLVREIPGAIEYLAPAGQPKSWHVAEDRLYWQRMNRRPLELDYSSPFDSVQRRDLTIPLVEGNPRDMLDIREIVEDGRDAALLDSQAEAAIHVVTPDGLLRESDGPYLYARHGLDNKFAELTIDEWRPGRDLEWNAVSPSDLPSLESYMEHLGITVDSDYDVASWPTGLIRDSIKDKVVVHQARYLLSEAVGGLAIHTYPYEFVLAHLEYTDPSFRKDVTHPRLVELLIAGAKAAPEMGEVSFDDSSYRAAVTLCGERAMKSLELNGYLPYNDPTPSMPRR